MRPRWWRFCFARSISTMRRASTSERVEANVTGCLAFQSHKSWSHASLVSFLWAATFMSLILRFSALPGKAALVACRIEANDGTHRKGIHRFYIFGIAKLWPEL